MDNRTHNQPVLPRLCLLRLIETHACNATLHVIGRPALAAEDWIGLCVRTAGGFVGHLAWSDGMNGFAAFVPGEDGRQGADPTDDCLAALDGCPSPGTASRFRSILAAMTALAATHPPAEASLSLAGASIDLARGIAHLPWPRTEAVGNAIHPVGGKPPGGAAGALAARIKARSGFLLSVSDRGALMVMAAGETAVSASIHIVDGKASLALDGGPPIEGLASAAALGALSPGSEAQVLLMGRTGVEVGPIAGVSPY